ncbi:hypothetical protein K438DRAFT_701379 [Mycena galopus ATCC 62051]|nr:hypothetical protein K438DRAFT_701379 [Mycena galopus ATCC 62051]
MLSSTLMFSRSNHHDQKVPTHGLAPPTFLAPQLLAGDLLLHSDTLSVHYLRLEASLDSALAALTIIRDHVHTTTTPALSGHMIAVLQALCRHASVLAPHHTPDTDPTPPPPPSLPSTTTPTTYAETMTGTATDPVAKPEEDRGEITMADAKPPAVTVVSPTPHLPKMQTRPDLIFRLDHLPRAVSAASRPSTARLFIDIREKAKSLLGDLHLASIRWTAKGNLTFAFLRDGKFTAEKAMKQAPMLWNFIRLTLRMPKHYSPRVDAGDSWHNVVIHAVPQSGPISDSSDCTVHEWALQGVDSWLRTSGVVGEIKEMSFMCKDTDLLTRNTAPLRVSLSSPSDADLLIRNGALVLGTRCRVSRYIPKTLS